jgi:3,4-dihydroxy 2-butanone 4-phosphate synthase/GTP cyclohydrolase II
LCTREKMAFSCVMSGIVRARMLCDLGVTSIRNLTPHARHQGLSGFGAEIIANERLEG